MSISPHRYFVNRRFCRIQVRPLRANSQLTNFRKGRFLHYGQWIGEKPPSAQQRVRLAIIAALEKKPADFAAFLRLMEESGFAVKRGRGGVVSFLALGQDKYTRLRASTLGPGFDPEDIRAVINGERPLPELPKDAPPPPRQVGLIIDMIILARCLH